MSPNADIIRLLIIEESLGVVGGGSVPAPWTVYVGFLPAEGDKAIAVYDMAGKLDGRIMATGEQIEHPGVQIRIRGPKYPEAFQRAQEIAEMLDVQKGREIEMPGSGPNYTLLNISRAGGVLPIGIEEGDRIRHHFTINATLTVKES